MNCKQNMKRREFVLNPQKAASKNLKINFIYDNKMLKIFFLRMGTRKSCSLLSFLFNNVLETLASRIRQEKEIQGMYTQKNK